MIQVRRVQPQDLDYILDNADELGFIKEDMLTKLENMMLVIESSIICGIGFFVNSDGCCLLNWVYIKEGYRRNRFGTMLVKTMLNTSEHQGASQALLSGGCQEFAEFLGFQKVSDDKELNEMRRMYKDSYNFDASDNIYKVSLLDYFKPCCHQN